MNESHSLIKPPRLRAGDTVCAISLSSGAAGALPHRFEQGKRQLAEAFDLRIVEAPHARADDDWLYHNPEARADDLNWALLEPEVKGIVSVIGGDDSVRILPFVDHELIRTNPKVFMGFSDATVTLTAFRRAGVVAFHGPAVMTDLAENGGIRPFVLRSVRRTLFEAWAGPLEYATEWTEQFIDWRDPALLGRPRHFVPNEGPAWLQGEEAVEGPLVGGNIEVLEFLKGTRWWLDDEHWDGAVLCIETSEEAPSVEAVKRYLRNYGSQGVLDRVVALLLARPQHYTQRDRWRLHEGVTQVLAEFGRHDMPVVANLDFGHTSPQMVLPLGCQLRVDCSERTLVLLEPGVS